jgi:Co/Zn/Cd efflux system component
MRYTGLRDVALLNAMQLTMNEFLIFRAPFRWEAATLLDTGCALVVSVSTLTMAPLARDILDMLLQRVPRDLDTDLVSCFHQIRALDGVSQLAEPHFWSQSLQQRVGTLFIRVTSDCDTQKVIVSLNQRWLCVFSCIAYC